MKDPLSLSLFAACWLGLSMATAASAAAAAQSIDQRNAATWYQRAIARYQALRNRSPQVQEMLDAYAENPAQPPPPQLRAILAEADPLFREMRRGAEQGYADFALDYDQGFELLLPHLGELRNVANLMRADAAIRLQEGDSAGAAARMADMYRMAGHMGGDSIIISSLVGQAIFNTADNAAQLGLDAAAFSPSDATDLLHAAEALGTDDPFSVVDAVAMEQQVAVATLEKYRDMDREAFFGLLGNEGNEPPIEQIIALSDDDWSAEIGKYDAAMNRVVEAFMNDDPDEAKAALGRIEQEVISGEHGVFANILMPALGKVLERKLEAEARIAARIALYRDLATGVAKQEEIANAAVWYLRAIEMLAKLDPAKLDAIRAAAGPPLGGAVKGGADQPLPEPATSVLDEAQPIIDLLREASQIMRCDFRFAQTPFAKMPLIAQPYVGGVGGMHDCLKLLRADAARMLWAKESDAAADRLSIIIRASEHLGAGDAEIVSALVAHRNFTEAMRLVEPALNGGTLGDSHKAALFSAVQRVSPKDPFGYIDALVETRKKIAEHFNRARARDEEELQRWLGEMARINQFNGDELLYVLTILNTMAQAGAAEAAAAAEQAPPAANAEEAAANGAAAPAMQPAQPITDPLAILADVLALDALEHARDEVVLVAPRLAADDWDLFTGRAVPNIGNVAANMSRARAALREAVLLLRPDDDEGEGKP